MCSSRWLYFLDPQRDNSIASTCSVHSNKDNKQTHNKLTENYTKSISLLTTNETNALSSMRTSLTVGVCTSVTDGVCARR